MLWPYKNKTFNPVSNELKLDADKDYKTARKLF